MFVFLAGSQVHDHSMYLMRPQYKQFSPEVWVQTWLWTRNFYAVPFHAVLVTRTVRLTSLWCLTSLVATNDASRPRKGNLYTWEKSSVICQKPVVCTSSARNFARRNWQVKSHSLLRKVFNTAWDTQGSLWRWQAHECVEPRLNI